MTRHPIAQFAENGNPKSPKTGRKIPLSCNIDYFATAATPRASAVSGYFTDDYFLARPEIEALLAVPDRTTWLGRRDYALLLLAVQTGLRVSELISLDRDTVHIGRGAHVPMCRQRPKGAMHTCAFRSNVIMLPGPARGELLPAQPPSS
jgi:hypothetical protein